MAPSQPPGDQRPERPIGSRRSDLPGIPVTGLSPEPSRGGGGGRGFARRVLNLLLLCAALALLAGLAYGVYSFAGLGSDDVPAGQPVTVVIPKGSSSSQIADILAEAGVVRNETTFRARLKLNGDGSQFRSGTFKMKTGSSYDSVVRVLETGPVAAPTFNVTIPEGQRMEETAALIDRMRTESVADGGKQLPAFTGAEYLKAVRAQTPPAELKAKAGTKSMEGLLFPATYELKQVATAQELVDKQLAATQSALSEIDMAKAAKANLTPYDIVTIASLIEREAAVAKERPLVSAVIWNRLKVGEPLGIDAANQYYVYKPGNDEFWSSSLKQSELEQDSPFNLRKVQGLPPTPIAAPGRASLEAAAAPADVPYRYYVTKGDGSGEHFFTDDYDEFLAKQ